MSWDGHAFIHHQTLVSSVEISEAEIVKRVLLSRSTRHIPLGMLYGFNGCFIRRTSVLIDDLIGSFSAPIKAEISVKAESQSYIRAKLFQEILRELLAFILFTMFLSGSSVLR